MWKAIGWIAAAPLLCQAEITNVRITGTTATQALLSYTAPDNAACAIQVSESQSLTPLVHDVDEGLFSGSSSDSRTGAVTSGRSRLVAIGKHGMMAQGVSNPFLGRDGRRYSRALAANTTHYYKISCGSDTATGSFQTGNILPGSTYPEPLPADGTNPGAYNWPSVSATDRSESIVDPNTGSTIRKLSLDAESSSDFSSQWPSGGAAQICSHLMEESGGHTYTTCIVLSAAPTLFSIETDTGMVYPLTRLYVPYGRFGASSFESTRGPSFSGTDMRKVYFMVNQPGLGSRVFAARWNGPLNVARPVPAWPFVLNEGVDGVSLTLLTPQHLGTMLAAFDSTYDATQQANLTSLILDGAQNGKLIFHIDSQQDSLGWIFVFDPGNDMEIGSGGTGRIVAANPFWRSPVSRWCSLHSLMPSGDHNPWVQVTSNSPGRYGDAGYMGSKYIVTVANDAGKGNLIQIAPTNGSYEPQSTSTAPAYLQDAQIGDLFWVNAMGPYGTEPVEIVAKDNVNHTWTVIRGNNLKESRFIKGSDVPPNSVEPVDIKAGMKLYAGCRGSSFSQAIGWGSAVWYWNFENDAHGTSIAYPAVNGTTSDQVVENYGSGGHVVNRDGVNYMEAVYGDTYVPAWMKWTYPNSTPGYDLATPPAGAPINIVSALPGFASIKLPYLGSDDFPKHPSFDQMAASSRDKQWLVDAMPFLNQSGSMRGTGTLVSGLKSTYKMSGVVLHPKQVGALASCGTHPLLDISSASTGNLISDATPYTFCVVSAAGECRSGSSAGDVFVSCPGVTTPSCVTSSQSGQTDICLGDGFVYGNGGVQVSLDTHDNNGASGRLISQLFSINHQESTYNSVRPTADGSWMLFVTGNLTAFPEIYMARMPSFPALDSSRRDTFVPVQVSIVGPANASTALVQFGYAENGAPESFHCTSRQETCVAQSAVVDESQPFLYATSEASSITGMPCGGRRQGVRPSGGGCTITIPAIPGRILYYRTLLRDTSGNLLQEQQMTAIAVP